MYARTAPVIDRLVPLLDQAPPRGLILSRLPASASKRQEKPRQRSLSTEPLVLVRIESFVIYQLLHTSRCVLGCIIVL